MNLFYFYFIYYYHLFLFLFSSLCIGDLYVVGGVGGELWEEKKGKTDDHCLKEPLSLCESSVHWLHIHHVTLMLNKTNKLKEEQNYVTDHRSVLLNTYNRNQSTSESMHVHAFLRIKSRHVDMTQAANMHLVGNKTSLDLIYRTQVWDWHHRRQVKRL